VDQNEIISTMLSDQEGKYYITVLGASTQLRSDFEREIVQSYIDKIAGFYTNQNPSEIEIRQLDVVEKPIFIVFDTQSEVFKTNNIIELNEYLKDSN
jgi:hypothetical protein